MAPLVSVIVPVFNSEKYLNACLDSILSQSVTNIEIILIDDGSSDNSPLICNAYSEKYHHVRVVHQENKGVSASRNLGLELSTGKFVHFCDSDDIMKPDMLLQMLNAAQDFNVDIVIAGYDRFPGGGSFYPGFIKDKAVSPSELVASCSTIHTGNDLCFSWRMLMRSELLKINQIKFDEELCIGEDFIFNLQAIMKADMIVVLGKSLYEYRIDNPNSVMKEKYKECLDQQLGLQYEKKMKLTYEYGLDDNKCWMEDMAYYYITRFLDMLFQNAVLAPSVGLKNRIKNIVRSPMIQNSFDQCGRRLYMDGIKNTIFRLACRYEFWPLIMYCARRKLP